MELAWVGLNYLGVERATTEATVRSVSDIHLAYMPYSHSVATAAGGALLVWLVIEKGRRRPLLAVIVLGNLANITLFSASIPGPEEYLAGHPLTVVTVIAAQIVVTAILIDLLAVQTHLDFSTVRAARARQTSRA